MYSDPVELPQGCSHWVWMKSETSDDPNIKKIGELTIRGMT